MLRNSVFKLVILLAVVILTSWRARADPVSIGHFPSLAHGLQGEVIILNDKQFRIRGFSYDGQGPAVWFMGMKNGTTGIYSADGIAFPNHLRNCNNLRRAYHNADITITLPRRVKMYDLEALSVYCYEFCHNFGYVKIPKGMKFSAPPPRIPNLRTCNPKYRLCSKEETI